MEIWDGYNKDGTLAGVDIVRGEPIPEGLYFLTVEILVRHVDGDYLLMHRSPEKSVFPDYLEATAGGGAVTVTINGKKEILNIEIAPEIVDPDDIETLSDILVAGVNEAIKKVESTNAAEMEKITGSMTMPGLF